MRAMNLGAEPLLSPSLPQWDSRSGPTSPPMPQPGQQRGAVLDILKEQFKGVAVIEIALLNQVVLIRVVADLVADYEALKFLMAEHDLKRGDLPEIGSQGAVSEILTGKRDLNVRQVRALAAQFSVSTETFLNSVDRQGIRRTLPGKDQNRAPLGSERPPNRYGRLPTTPPSPGSNPVSRAIGTLERPQGSTVWCSPVRSERSDQALK